MKKYLYLMLAMLCIAGVIGFTQLSQKVEAVSPNLVISQVQAGGAANANDEFIEIKNIGNAAVDLNGYRVVYRSASGTNDVGPMAIWSTSTILQPGQFYLIAANSYDGTVAADMTYNTSTCSCSMSATSGGVAIRQGASNTGTVIDSVGWGAATNAFVEGTVTPASQNDNSVMRKLDGCQDTDNNANDFSILTPSGPRNTATSPITCSGGGTTIFGSMNANPTTVAPSGTTLVTVTVIPATDPQPSTGITVTSDLSQIGGSATQTLFDNGTNGDTTSGDNVFSFMATVAANTSGGTKTLTGVVADAQGRSTNVSKTITVNAATVDDDPLALGNPSNATADTANENNYLMVKPQYSLSYSRTNGTPNWVAWKLDSTWLGSADRQDDYRADTTLPSGWYQVQDNDYSGSGYDRGHMCPSGDRTRSVADNSATFLMTNFVPQYGPNNQGPWNDFENYLRSLAAAGKEMYIVSGGVGSLGTIASGHVVIPKYTWKVVVVLDNGTNDLSRIGRQTRTIGIVVPNFAPVTSSTPWRTYRKSVDQIEAMTGYNFFSNIPINTQAIIERRPDRE